MSKLEAQAPGYLSIKLSLRIWFKAIAQPFLSSYNELAEIRTKPLQAYVWIVGSGLITGLIIFLLNWGIGVKKQLPINSTDLRNIFLDPLFALILFSLSVCSIHLAAKILGGKGTFERFAFLVSCFYAPLVAILDVLSTYIYGSFVILIPFYILILYLFILFVLAVKVVHGFSSIRSFFTTFVPYLAGSIIIILLLISKYISAGK